MNNKAVYILSVEASDIFNNMYRDGYIKPDYVGCIPYSLELIKLKQVGLKIKVKKNSKKQVSTDLISLNFESVVQSGDKLLELFKKKLEELQQVDVSIFDEDPKGLNLHYYNLAKYQRYIDEITKKTELDKWKSVNTTQLREMFYENGFTTREINFETGEVSESKYVRYKRTSSNSRKGKCLFIKEELYNEMIEWSRMYLPFEEGMNVDLAGLMAYESLVLSSIENTVQINPKNILIVDDVEHEHEKLCSVVREGDDERLGSFTEPSLITSNLFDGQSLLDGRYFTNGKAMLLLRNHFFKSAAFSTNLQKFYRDYHDKHLKDQFAYEEWKIPNMYGQPMYVKDIHMVITPSSLKALKFASVLGEGKKPKDMWNYWCNLVQKENNVFGVCKSEKSSKKGDKINQVSYQILNSIPVESLKDMSKLTEFQKQYITDLKNDDEKYIDYLEREASNIDAHNMFVDLYRRNNKIANTKVFRDYRKNIIHKYVKKVRRGKVLFKGDYAVLFGNPYEFLLHSIDKFDINDSEVLTLKENEIYTTMFDFGKKLVGFRNPHTTISNILLPKNKEVTEIREYFNLTDNIVCVNCVGFELQHILNGSDFDSDTLLLLYDNQLYQQCKEYLKRYPIAVNSLEPEKKPYQLNNIDMCSIDQTLSGSTKSIGNITNTAQLLLSHYWDKKSEGVSEEELKELMKSIDVLMVLSGISIDLAKKLFQVNLTKELNHIIRKHNLTQQPVFLELVKENNRKYKKNKKENKKEDTNSEEKEENLFFNCPMDFLIQDLKKVEAANKKNNIELIDLLIKNSTRNSNKSQRAKVLKYTDEMRVGIQNAQLLCCDKEERFIKIDEIVKEFSGLISKLKIKEDTMFAILKDFFEKDKITQRLSDETKGLHVTLLNLLYNSQKEVFLQAFKKYQKFPQQVEQTQ